MKSKYLVKLVDKEIDHGLTFIAISRVKMFSNIRLFDEITKDRLYSKVKNKEI